MAKKKKNGGFLGRIKGKVDEVQKYGKNLAQKAAEKAPDAHATIKKHGKEKLQSGYSAAKKIASQSSTTENLELLEKLGKLRDNGILSEKEFQEKKKEILEKI